jgi:hypothetical protein
MTPSGPSLDQPAEAAAFPVASCGGSWNVSSRARSFSICEGLNRSEPIERSARLANTRNHNQLAEPSQYNPITPDGRPKRQKKDRGRTVRHRLAYACLQERSDVLLAFLGLVLHLSAAAAWKLARSQARHTS